MASSKNIETTSSRPNLFSSSSQAETPGVSVLSDLTGDTKTRAGTAASLLPTRRTLLTLALISLITIATIFVYNTLVYNRSNLTNAVNNPADASAAGKILPLSEKPDSASAAPPPVSEPSTSLEKSDVTTNTAAVIVNDPFETSTPKTLSQENNQENNSHQSLDQTAPPILPKHTETTTRKTQTVPHSVVAKVSKTSTDKSSRHENKTTKTAQTTRQTSDKATANVAHPKSAPAGDTDMDSDVALLSAIVAHDKANPTPPAKTIKPNAKALPDKSKTNTSQATERKPAQTSATKAETTQSRLARCDKLDFFAASTCRQRVCAKLRGDPACPEREEFARIPGIKN